MSDQIKILLAEDDPNFGSVLKDYLALRGYHVMLCTDGESALHKFKNEKSDLCILDVMMPLKDGFTLAKEIKETAPNMPIIFLTAKTSKQDILKGYLSGADDYITKPFDSEILILKIKAVLNRKTYDTNPEAFIYQIGKYRFDYPSRSIAIDDKKKKLSPKESELLKMLCEHINEVLPRQKALKKIWGDDNYFSGRSMDVYITKLRKYLNEDASVTIENLHGSGYKMNAT